MASTTEPSRETWQGFCEIESEPAFLNIMLREWGVRGAKVRELYSLDDLGADYIPKPIYGIIYCFRYFEPDYEKQEKSCPEHIWFANQIAANSCASVALLNILNNIPELDLGENLRSFKDFTRAFTPFLRGEQLAHFDFVKRIHNSFANKTEMLNSDLSMKNDYDEALKAKARKSKSKAKNGTSKPPRDRKRTNDEYDAEAPYHYQAFMPIGGDLWKLDGMDWQPEKLGSFEESEDWTTVFAPMLQERVMLLTQTYQCEVNVMCLYRDETLLRDPDDDKKAQDRRTDYGPFIRAWLEELAGTGVLRDLVEPIRAGV